MIANVPAVLLGERLAGRIPTRIVHGLAGGDLRPIGAGNPAGAGAAPVS